MSKVTLNTSDLFNNISQLIENAKLHISAEINLTLIMLNWHIGDRINQSVLQDKRAAYGENVIPLLATQLQQRYTRGYDSTSLSRMVKFAKLYPKKEDVLRLSQSRIGWTHVRYLIAVDDELKREFYTEMCLVENWSIRTLRDKMNGLLYERTALAKKPKLLIKQELQQLRETKTPSPAIVFHDPVFLDLAGLPRNYSELELEDAILNDLTKFLQEFGNNFCFVERQKRMSTQNKDRYLDLLFFHRGLRRLIAIELKLDAFEPAHKGQMEWYLNWLDKNERKPGEEKPIGIILCGKKDQEDVEYLELDSSGIHVAQYLTELPPKELLEAKLRELIDLAREKHERLKIAYSEEESK